LLQYLITLMQLLLAGSTTPLLQLLFGKACYDCSHLSV